MEKIEKGLAKAKEQAAQNQGMQSVNTYQNAPPNNNNPVKNNNQEIDISLVPIVGPITDGIDEVKAGSYGMAAVSFGFAALDVASLGEASIARNAIKGGVQAFSVAWRVGSVMARVAPRSPLARTAAAQVVAKFAGKSINQLNKLVQAGKAPKSIKRFDLGKVKGEISHVHFDNGAALNINGTWKHGSKVLTNKEIKFLQENGWTIP